MTAKELILAQINDVGFQLNVALSNIDPADWEKQVVPEAMSAAETALHLCECYTAFLAHANDLEHSWGTYSLDDTSQDNVLKTRHNLREQAIQQLSENFSEKSASDATAYIILHDAYHVGQLCTLRLKLGNFDAYSIYQH